MSRAGRLDNQAEYAFFVGGSLYQSLAKLRAVLVAESFAIDRPRSNFWFLYGDRAGLATPGVPIGAMAADLQEPSEFLMQTFELLRREEADIVFWQRVGRGPHSCTPSVYRSHVYCAFEEFEQNVPEHKRQGGPPLWILHLGGRR